MAVQITYGYRDRLLDDVRHAAQWAGDRYLSAALWDEWAAATDRPLSGQMRYWFGSWPNVIDAAGLPGMECYRHPSPAAQRARADDDAVPIHTLADELFTEPA